MRGWGKGSRATRASKREQAKFSRGIMQLLHNAMDELELAELPHKGSVGIL